MAIHSVPCTGFARLQEVFAPLRERRNERNKKMLANINALVSPAGTLYMCYAAGHTRGQEYCTGIMKFLGGKNDSLANASLWKKMDEPLHFVDYSSRVYSPGAMMFTTSPDGSEIWAVYHAKQYTYTAYTMRRLYTQKVTWENDFPVIDDPQPIDTVFTYAKNPRAVDSVISGFGTRGTVTYTPPAQAPYDVEFDDIEPFVDKPVSMGLSALAIGLIAGGAALVVGGGVTAGVIVSKKKKKKAADGADAPTDGTDAPEASETNETAEAAKDASPEGTDDKAE
jgi:hypothetical protein